MPGTVERHQNRRMEGSKAIAQGAAIDYGLDVDHFNTRWLISKNFLLPATRVIRHHLTNFGYGTQDASLFNPHLKEGLRNSKNNSPYHTNILEVCCATTAPLDGSFHNSKWPLRLRSFLKISLGSIDIVGLI